MDITHLTVANALINMIPAAKDKEVRDALLTLSTNEGIAALTSELLISCSTNDDVFNTLIFDRSDPHASVAYDSKTKKHTTRLEDIQRSFFYRRDLGMVNFKDGRQELVYGRKDGTVEWNGMERFFPDHERLEIEEIVKRILEVGKKHPEMLGYLL